MGCYNCRIRASFEVIKLQGGCLVCAFFYPPRELIFGLCE